MHAARIQLHGIDNSNAMTLEWTELQIAFSNPVTYQYHTTLDPTYSHSVDIPAVGRIPLVGSSRSFSSINFFLQPASHCRGKTEAGHGEIGDSRRGERTPP